MLHLKPKVDLKILFGDIMRPYRIFIFISALFLLIGLVLALDDESDAPVIQLSVWDELDDYPPTLDRRGRWLGCRIPVEGEQICRVLVDWQEMIYLVEIPLLVNPPYTAPVPSATPTLVIVPVDGDNPPPQQPNNIGNEPNQPTVPFSATQPSSNASPTPVPPSNTPTAGPSSTPTPPSDTPPP